MRKDPTEFRERFARWKNGELVYKAGLPHYEDGKDARTLEYHPEEDYYYGGNLFGKGNELVVTGLNKKPHTHSPHTSYYGKNYQKWDTLDLLESMITGSDAGDVVDVGKDLYNKNYAAAGVGAAMFAIPNVVEKPLKYVTKSIIIPAYMRKVKTLSPTEKVEQIVSHNRLLRQFESDNNLPQKILPETSNDDIQLLNSLRSQGVDISKFDRYDILAIKNSRIEAVSSAKNTPRRGMYLESHKYDGGINALLYDNIYRDAENFNTIGKIRTKRNPIASQNTRDTFKKIPHANELDKHLLGVLMINNFTLKSKYPVKGVSEDLYNIILQGGKETGNHYGLLSGDWLFAPWATTRVTTPDKYILQSFPETSWHYGYDVPQTSNILFDTKTADVPYKRMPFDLQYVDDLGNFIIDWTTKPNF